MRIIIADTARQRPKFDEIIFRGIPIFLQRLLVLRRSPVPRTIDTGSASLKCCDAAKITRSSAIAERPRCRAYSYFYYSFPSPTTCTNGFLTVTAAVVPVNCGNSALEREGLLSLGMLKSFFFNDTATTEIYTE